MQPWRHWGHAWGEAFPILEGIMHKILLSALLATVAMPAFAADMPVKAPIREPIPYADWSGIYVGIEGGYGWGRQKWDADTFTFGGGNNDNTVRLPATGFPALAVTNRVIIPDLDASLPTSLKNRGWVAGGFAGAQKQMGNWVIGLEADFDAADIKGSSSLDSTFKTDLNTQILTRQLLTPVISIPGGVLADFRPGVVGATVEQSTRMETKLDQLGTLRGKVGITNIFSPSIMIYGTGGLAWAHHETTLTADQTVRGIMNPAVLATGAIGTRAFTDTVSLEANSSGYMFGWSAGAGIDWKIMPNLVLGALYLHYEFPKDTLAFTESGVRVGNSQQSIDVVKGRLSVLFPIQ